MDEISHPVVVIVGPTASGKSDLAQHVAQDIDGEVVSADSMQVYRGMDIGTGKIPESERIVAHHGIDLVDPGQPYSAALFQDYARRCFHDIDVRGKRSILAGGTGLYVRAAIDDYDFPQGEQTGNPVREKYLRFADEHGAAALWELLNERDPASAEVIHPHNVRRVVRAFELHEAGESYARQKERLAAIPQKVSARFIGLDVEPDLLRRRIDVRVDHMIEKGLVDEVAALHDRGFRSALTASQAIGYKEVVSFLEGACTLEETVEAIKTATRRYAKRQRSWFRKDERIAWIDANEGVDATVPEAMRLLEDRD